MMNRAIPRTVALLMLLVVVAGCGTGEGVLRYGSFTFVSPGGRAEFYYPPAERGGIGDLSGPDLTSGGDIRLSDYAGEVVVLNVWGSWCGPCRGEVESLNVAASLTADKGVQFLGINVKDTRQNGADFHLSRQVPYPSIFDPSMRTLRSLNGFPTNSIPSTIVLDRQHRVAQIFLRVITPGELVSISTAIAQESDMSSSPATGPTSGP